MSKPVGCATILHDGEKTLWAVFDPQNNEVYGYEMIDVLRAGMIALLKNKGVEHDLATALAADCADDAMSQTFG